MPTSIQIKLVIPNSFYARYVNEDKCRKDLFWENTYPNMDEGLETCIVYESIPKTVNACVPFRDLSGTFYPEQLFMYALDHTRTCEFMGNEFIDKLIKENECETSTYREIFEQITDSLDHPYERPGIVRFPSREEGEPEENTQEDSNGEIGTPTLGNVRKSVRNLFKPSSRLDHVQLIQWVCDSDADDANIHRAVDVNHIDFIFDNDK